MTYRYSFERPQILCWAPCEHVLLHPVPCIGVPLRTFETEVELIDLRMQVLRLGCCSTVYYSI